MEHLSKTTVLIQLRLSEEAVNMVKNMDEPKGEIKIGSLEAMVLENLPELLSTYHGMYSISQSPPP